MATIASLPPEILKNHIFQYLELHVLAQASLVSQEWNRQVGLQAKFATLPKKCRDIHVISEAEWEQEGLEGIEKRLRTFIQGDLISGKVHQFKVIFNHYPDAHISFWMCKGVSFDTTYDIENKGEVDPAQLVLKRYVVLSRENDPALQVADNGCTSECGKGLQLPSVIHDFAYTLLPLRWYHGTHQNVRGWSHGASWQDGGHSQKICEVASKKIQQLDREVFDRAKRCALAVTMALVACTVKWVIG